MTPETPPSINSWLEDELYQQYRSDRQAVDSSWTHLFEAPENGGALATEAAPSPEPENRYLPITRPPSITTITIEPSQEPVSRGLPAPQVPIGPEDQALPLRGPALKIAENMIASLTMPVATSQRVMPVKVMEENRRVINDRRALTGASKISFTHLVAWAIVRSIEKVPALNDAFAQSGADSFRVRRGHVNLGIAVDVAGKDGARSLKVPSVKSTESLNFATFLAAYDDLVVRARGNKLTVSDFEGTTLSLTNPGTVGTVGSIPRLMPGQGAIIATGAIDYPPEYRGVPDELRASLGLSKVMTVTCTYDHRVIQGAESGAFLAQLQSLLEGEQGFYDQIYADLGIPLAPVRWHADQPAAPSVNADPAKQAAVARLIDAWRQKGHLAADIDPLGVPRAPHPDLDPLSHGLTIWDLDRTFHAGAFGVTTLRALIDRLRLTYASKMGVEYMHVEDAAERLWFQQRMEPTANQWMLDPTAKRRALKTVIEAEGFEGFLENRFKGSKRFSIEGGESTIAVIEELVDRAANAGVQEIVMGMAHRGRLTVLANVIGKGIAQVFSEFEGEIDEEFEGSGDVKYHLGASAVRDSSAGKQITVFVAPNPSHLEAVNPVVEGIVRPKQDRLGDVNREWVIPVLIHGDAAMAGQGIVAETLNLSQIDGYNTGGTIHIVINNQIGFTTNPWSSRSSTYCSDVALMVHAPIFHVNGDDPEACLRATQLALDFRQKFRRDVVIDVLCWRKHGHNEGDDASYTQPVLYRKLKDHKSVATLYGTRLAAEGMVSAEEAHGWAEAQKKRLYAIYDSTQKSKEEWELHELTPLTPGMMPQDLPPTGVSLSSLEQVVKGATAFPAEFNVHPKLTKLVEKRVTSLHDNSIDWATAEMLAFGSLLLEGTSVRLSGQDAGRGTFSHRYAEYHDYENDRVYAPLANLVPGKARFEVYNSPLSEYGVMGFEFGYSVADPLSLVLWEAQYGDFVNGAMIIIDQFLVSAESKWGQPSGLVLLLPHGQEGGGPEHSSARMERFLQICAEANIQVANCTTPAQYFHLLRRQMRGGQDRRGLRKPLIVFSPKSLLRHPKVISTVDDLTNGSFYPVLDDHTVTDPASINKIVMCTGKLYYELLAAREARRATDENAATTAIVRIEQLYPFPEVEIRAVFERYPNASGVVWAQEEPRNMGAWIFMRTRLQRILANEDRAVGYAGRPESASTAPGSAKVHNREQAELIDLAFAPPTLTRRWRRRLIRRRRQWISEGG
ncbi:MAG: multifunctional oxoglutarate decarboxylase/oxoglutarate dehydrogenase thiamine pyrophosphate-binding subunit/dihydrolipoyllysine-residue succinyltransferase subunit [Bryobacteraceae bacterium]